DFPTAPLPLGNVNLKFLKHAKVLPLAQTNGTLTVAMSDPADYYTIQSLQLATGLQVEPRLARERDVLEALETIYGGGTAAGRATRSCVRRTSPSCACRRTGASSCGSWGARSISASRPPPRSTARVSCSASSTARRSS